MRLPETAHTTRPWRIHEIAPDFRVEGVWIYPTPGAGSEDFPAMLAALRAAGGLNVNPPMVRFLFAVRQTLGELLGWDKPQQGLEGRVESLCDRLPPELHQDAAGVPVPNTPLTMVYELDDECAFESANQTVHAICHLGWVPSETGEYELRMAALVKPHGILGRLYMAAAKPFRYLNVYPALTRKWERAWRNQHRYIRAAAGTPAGHNPAPCPATAGAPSRSHHHDDPCPAIPRHARSTQLTRWTGRLIVLYGTAHTLGGLTALGAARHAGAWFCGQLWDDDLASMSPAMSAYWLTVNSFGPPLILLGLTVQWLDRRGITPPQFIPWALGTWVAVGTVVAGPGIGQDLILLVAAGLLLARARRELRMRRSVTDRTPEAVRPGDSLYEERSREGCTVSSTQIHAGHQLLVLVPPPPPPELMPPPENADDPPLPDEELAAAAAAAARVAATDRDRS